MFKPYLTVLLLVLWVLFVRKWKVNNGLTTNDFERWTIRTSLKISYYSIVSTEKINELSLKAFFLKNHNIIEFLFLIFTFVFKSAHGVKTQKNKWNICWKNYLLLGYVSRVIFNFKVNMINITYNNIMLFAPSVFYLLSVKEYFFASEISSNILVEVTLETFPTCETLLFRFFIFSKFNEKKIERNGKR